MGFFDETDDLDKDGGFSFGENSFEPIPDRTDLLVVADAVAWSEWEGVRSIKIDWVALAPTIYKSRKVFHSLKVHDKDVKKRTKARTMLKAIDAILGGGLSTCTTEPTDFDLMKSIMGKQLVIKVRTWESDDKQKKGNWVCSVSAKRAVEDKTTSESTVEKQGDSLPF